MLTRVLLHVVEAARPIDDAMHVRSNLNGIAVFDNVRHTAVAFVDDLDHSRAAKCADVAGLASGGGIETRAIQTHARMPASSLDAQDRCVELSAIWIEVVEPLGHSVSSPLSRRHLEGT